MAKRSLAQRWADVSLRSKMTGVTVLILSFGLLVAGLGTMSLLKPSLYATQDAELLAIQRNPVSALQPGTSSNAITQENVVFANSRNYVALFGADGEFEYDNRHSDEAELPEIDALHFQNGALTIDGDIDFADGDTGAANGGVISFQTDEGSHWRAVIAPLYKNSNTPSGYLLVAAPTELLETIAAQYIAIFAGFGFAVILLGGALTRILVTATFEPLTEVERTAREIARGDFSKRIHVATPNTEVGHVGTSLNVMLDQINDAFNARAETIDKMRRFVGDAGHELRTPLVSVRGYAEMYRMGMIQNDEDVTQAMNRIEKEAIRMTSLVEDLLSLARLDSSRELEMKPLDLNAFAHDAAFDGMAQSPGRQIRAIECEHNPMALGDEHKVRQVMTNLIGNAIRHTDDGTPIEVAVSATREHAVFEIRDHGEGVPEQIRDKIFDRFWRADTSRNRETGGSGLGLSIVSSIVDAHKGTVKCVETPGGGATFRVELPLAEPIPALAFQDSVCDAATVFEQSKNAAKQDKPRRFGIRRAAKKADEQSQTQPLDPTQPPAPSA